MAGDFRMTSRGFYDEKGFFMNHGVYTPNASKMKFETSMHNSVS